jgi:ketosteroid isomerase-like protein
MNMTSATVAAPSQAISDVFAQALNAGDLPSAASCFARDGCLITPDLTAIHGRERIRPVLAQLIAGGIAIEVERANAVDAGGVQIARERWTIQRGRGATGFEQVCEPTLVLCFIEGSWRLMIAAPWGWESGRV